MFFQLKIIMSKNMKNMNMCAICVEPLSLAAGKHKEITCLHCYKSACRTCYQTFILDETTPKCMYPDCGNAFSRKFIGDNFTNAFITGELKKHREDIYFELEKALLPATQERVVCDIRNEERRIAIKNRNDVILEISRVYTSKCADALIENIHFLTQKFKRDIQDVRNAFNEANNDSHSVNKDPEAGKHRFIRPCSDTECKGFLSTAWKCGLCEKHACSKCHVVLEGDRKEHVCDADTLATAELIVSQSKPCPGCHINISKIDGCDQMWCTICNTAWDWKSGRIETKVHNPHYFEYLRNRPVNAVVPRNPDEVRCGRQIDNNFMDSFSQLLGVGKLGYTKRMQFMLTQAVTGMSHFDRFHIKTLSDSPNALLLRIKFMRNMIDEKQFKRGVQQLYKSFYKDKDMHEVFVMMKHLITEITYRYVDDFGACVTTEEKMKVSTLDEIEPLISYVNESLKTIAKTYQSTVYEVCLDPTNQKMYGLKSVKSAKPIVIE
jgi:hypothetical protein